MSDSETKVIRRNSVISSSDKDVTPSTSERKPSATERKSSVPERRSSKTDFEAVMEKIPYPRAVFFIIVCEFCERFCYYGMRAVLTLYFKNALGWSEDSSTVIYHIWVMLCYFTPLLGAMLADSVLGKFRTIFYLSVVYCAGSIVLSLAATPPLHIPTVAFSMIGLALIALGTGGIKPCVAAFGGDQFKIPGQESQLESYFAVFYFSINSGSLITQIITPIFREDVSCFGDDTCYPLAFAVPAALMIVALTIFLLGRPMYKIVKPQGNVVLKVLQAVKHSFSRKGSEIKAGRKRDHWLDYADDKFEQRFLDEAKVVFKVLFLYIPLPIFWTLFDQQGSRWTFQATRMNGQLSGSFGIKPDQMQVVNPILVLAFIPVFDRVIYPALGRCNLLKKPLQRLTVGLLFAGASFVVSGVVELFLVPTYAVELASGESTLQIVNAIPGCDLKIVSSLIDGGSEEIFANERAIYEAIETKEYTIRFTGSNDKCPGGQEDYTPKLESEKATTFVVTADISGKFKIVQSELEEDTEKSETGEPKLRIMYLNFDGLEGLTFNFDGKKEVIQFTPPTAAVNTSTEVKEVERDTYRMSVVHNQLPNGFTFDKTLEMKLGGSYLVTIVRYPDEVDTAYQYSMGFHEVTTPNTVHMLWLIPQFVIMTMGEIMFSITIMDFSYTEAPPNMKSVMQSAWLMTVAFGNLIVVIIAEAKIFKEQYKEFFLFAGIMFVDMFIFMFMAYRYKSSEKFWENDKIEDDADEKKGKDNDALDRSE